MGLNIFTLGSSKTYTRESLLGGGAVVGKNVTISSITPIEGGNKVTFSYTLDDGTVKTSSMNVMDGKDGIDGLPGKDGKDGLNGKDGQQGKDGSDGVGISKIEKIGTVDLVDIYRITFTDNSTFDYEITNGADGQGGTGGSGEENTIESISVNGVNVSPDENKNVDITVPNAYDDTALVQRISDIESDYAKSSGIPTKVSQLENDSNYLSSIPEEYVTDTELNAKGYLTEHQDISGKVDKVEGKSLIADTEIERLASVYNYDDTDIRAELANKADITAIPTVDVTKSYVDTELAKKADTDHTHTTVNGHTVESDVPVDAKFTDTVYDDSSLSSKVTQNTNDISALKTADNVLSSRVDTLTSLSEGSTTGDAELQDIRVKADGTTATSAGNAIREQISELKSDLLATINGTDVQINGTSIVDDCVANIPYATNKTAGVVIASGAYGISAVKGDLRTIHASNNDIKLRKGSYNTIVPTNYDFVVKSAMTDGVGVEWTDAERLACLLRMGCTVDDNGFVKWTAQEVTG